MVFTAISNDAPEPLALRERAGLRDIVRGATAADHAALDHGLAALDLRRRDDLRTFLGIHLAARAGLEEWLAEHCPPGWVPPQQTLIIADDLIASGGLPSAFPAPRFDPEFGADWLGPAYVVAGSHLGNRLLLAQAGADLPADARRFLTGNAMQDYWRRLRQVLAEPPGPEGGAATVSGARAAFAHFALCVDHFAGQGLAIA